MLWKVVENCWKLQNSVIRQGGLIMSELQWVSDTGKARDALWIYELITWISYTTSSPEAWLETANSVITPSDILPGTDSMSIQNDTQDTATISMDGR